jgi:threonylcarbamoyladenosine tRNA methylthiotransferase MtaB
MVDLITGNADKHRLLEVVEAETGKEALAFSPHESPLARTRSLVKIQQGCNDFCSFCIVPYVRGREHSISVKQVVEEVKKRVDIGYKEVMLTGTKIGAYGQDGKNSSPLVSLIKRILAETKLKRLRLSSLQPQELTPELVKLWHDERLCRHLHIPLQSGSETVLRRMRRRYSTADYERSVSLLREAVPNIAITTDVIVGFPGESGEEFEESYSFCKGMGFTSIHVFPYSRRIGTLAAQMPEQIKPEVKKERSQRMLALAQKSAHLFREQFLGQTIPVLWERKTGEGKWSGLSDNYLRVFTESKANLTNCLFGVKIVSEHEPGLWGKLIDEEG